MQIEWTISSENDMNMQLLRQVSEQPKARTQKITQGIELLEISLQRYGNSRNPSNHNNYENGYCNDCLQAYRIHLHSFESFKMLLS